MAPVLVSVRRDTGPPSGSRWSRDFCWCRWWWCCCGACDWSGDCRPHQSQIQCRCGHLLTPALRGMVGDDIFPINSPPGHYPWQPCVAVTLVGFCLTKAGAALPIIISENRLKKRYNLFAENSDIIWAAANNYFHYRFILFSD